MKKLLLLIDAQVDFVSPSVDVYDGLPGKLYIVGAEHNAEFLEKWIKINKEDIDSILCTMDTHYTTHIGHPKAWNDKKGHIVDPFTIITSEQVERDDYSPTSMTKERAVKYLKSVESFGHQHQIWPTHCLAGSVGQAIDEHVMRALEDWSELKKKHYGIFQKGFVDSAEMYSAFSYADGNIPDFSKQALYSIAVQNFDEIIVAGFAMDYCVAETVKDLVKDGRFEGKLIFLKDGMATINSKNPSLSIYDDAVKNHGAKFI